MTQHKTHQIQLTSLLQYFPENQEQIFNQKFRMQVHREIIELLKEHDDLTDRELQFYLGYKERNNVSPRRYELTNPEETRYKDKDGKPYKYKFGWHTALVVESQKRMCSVSNKLCISWRLSDETLQRYLRC